MANIYNEHQKGLAFEKYYDYIPCISSQLNESCFQQYLKVIMTHDNPVVLVTAVQFEKIRLLKLHLEKKIIRN